METLVDTERQHTHEGTVLLTAARAMGVDIQPADVLYIRAASRLAAVIDDMVDNEGLAPDVETIIESPAIELAGRFSRDDEQLVISAIEALTPFHYDAWIGASSLPAHAQAKRQAPNVRVLSEALTCEAELFTRIFSLDSIAETTDGASRRTYNTWLRHFARGGYCVDQAVDLRTDFEQGRVSVPPTLPNQAYMWAIGADELRHTLKHARSPRFLSQLGRTAALTIRESKRQDLSTATR